MPEITYKYYPDVPGSNKIDFLICYIWDRNIKDVNNMI